MSDVISLVLLVRPKTDDRKAGWLQIFTRTDNPMYKGKPIAIAGEPGNRMVTIGEQSWSEASNELILDIGPNVAPVQS